MTYFGTLQGRIHVWCNPKSKEDRPAIVDGRAVGTRHAVRGAERCNLCIGRMSKFQWSVGACVTVSLLAPSGVIIAVTGGLLFPTHRNQSTKPGSETPRAYSTCNTWTVTFSDKYVGNKKEPRVGCVFDAPSPSRPSRGRAPTALRANPRAVRHLGSGARRGGRRGRGGGGGRVRGGNGAPRGLVPYSSGRS